MQARKRFTSIVLTGAVLAGCVSTLSCAVAAAASTGVHADNTVHLSGRTWTKTAGSGLSLPA